VTKAIFPCNLMGSPECEATVVRWVKTSINRVYPDDEDLDASAGCMTPLCNWSDQFTHPYIP